jgi:prepilin-type N-terminal cleavage/methylation domain-containing protein
VSVRARAAFTLMEMLVVIAILGVVAGVTAPAIRALRATDPLQAATSEATTLIVRARRTAMERAIPVRVTIDPLTRRYSVRGLVYGAPPESVTTDSLHVAAEVQMDVPAGRRLVMVFSPTGEVRGDTLVIRWRGQVSAVSADPWTGDAHVTGR